jgi:hypothetical protein
MEGKETAKDRSRSLKFSLDIKATDLLPELPESSSSCCAQIGKTECELIEATVLNTFARGLLGGSVPGSGTKSWALT